MARSKPLITDEQWEQIKDHLPEPPERPRGGRPLADTRKTFEGILWVLKTGARWCDLPEEYPSPSTCWRRLKKWEEEGVWETVWRKLLSKLDENKKLDWSENFSDGSFAAAKKGALASGKPKKAKALS